MWVTNLSQIFRKSLIFASLILSFSAISYGDPSKPVQIKKGPIESTYVVMVGDVNTNTLTIYLPPGELFPAGKPGVWVHMWSSDKRQVISRFVGLEEELATAFSGRILRETQPVRITTYFNPFVSDPSIEGLIVEKPYKEILKEIAGLTPKTYLEFLRSKNRLKKTRYGLLLSKVQEGCEDALAGIDNPHPI